MSNETPASGMYEYTFSFTPVESDDIVESGVEISVETDDTPDNESVRADAFSSLAEALGVNIEDVRKSWDASVVRTGYTTTPWDDSHELACDLEAIEGVEWIHYEDPYNSAYREPRYHLSVGNSSDPDEVEESVLSYFSGLKIERETEGAVSVVISTQPSE